MQAADLPRCGEHGHVEHLPNRANPSGKPRKIRQVDSLVGVADRSLGLRVDLDDRAVEAGRGRREGKRFDERAPPARVRWIEDDGQMRQFAQAQRAAEIAHVAGVLVEAADTAFAEDDPRIAFEQHVFGREQQLVEGRGRSAFEQNRQSGRGGGGGPRAGGGGGGAPAGAARNSGTFCMLRAPIWIMST